MTLILSLNTGSSSCKVQLYEMPSEAVLCNGLFERIGLDGGFFKIKFNDTKIEKEAQLDTHYDAIKIFFDILVEEKVIADVSDIKAVGHRIVHGGEKYASSIVINDEVANDIDQYSELAPLHNPANFLGYQVTKEILKDAMHVAVFDTAFHQSMTKETFMYPIPYRYYEQYKIRKYGFHGTSHHYVSSTLVETLPDANFKKIITCHLGNGASITAINEGKCVNTSMGFTPLAGIMMGTRTGDIDPAILSYIQDVENISADQVSEICNRQSGLLGVSEVSSDLRDVKQAADEHNEKAILAIDMYVERVAMTIGSYITQLGGCDAIVFTAGVGENAIFIRERVLNYLSHAFKIELSNKRNDQRGDFFEITTDDSSIKAYVIATNEELMIARDTYQFYTA